MTHHHCSKISHVIAFTNDGVIDYFMKSTAISRPITKSTCFCRMRYVISNVNQNYLRNEYIVTSNNLRCLINVPPPIINFYIFSSPPDLEGFLRLLVLKLLTFYELLIKFPFFVRTIYAQFSRQNSMLLCIF